MKGVKKIDTLIAVNYQRERNFYYLLLILFSVFLNQTSIIGGINFSLSDFIILALLFYLVCSGIKIPVYHLVFFLLMSAITVLTSIFFTPNKFAITVDIESLIKEYLKLVVVFLYFLVGFNIKEEKVVHLVLRWYSNAALFVAILGIMITVLGLNFFYQIYDFGEARYNGFMNDPNYFSIIQISVLPFFLRTEKISLKAKFIFFISIAASILLSGSKTGFITLILYMMMFGFGRLFNKFKLKTIFSTLFFILVLITFIGFLKLLGTNISFNFEENVQFQRIALLFTDMNAAFNEDGSSRLPIWLAGLHLISLSPFIGVGVGMYSIVSEKVSGIGAVAHNTYLQSYSDWGGLLATIFFVYLAVLLLKVTLNKHVKTDSNILLRDILFIFLIGSFGVSFNNARMFWFFLGMLVYGIRGEQQGEIQNRIS